MSYQLKLLDSKREREKINRPEHTAGHSQNKGTEQVQRRARRLQNGPAPLETGGSGEGKGAGSAPRTASPTTLQTGLQFLTKDFLRFWMANIRQEGRAGRDWGWGRAGEKARRTGESAPVKLLAA